ncbi:MAG: hypothetical protein H6738_17225 [Alphaproteobacteria bacterium]|nr:hypothetical protein [Alphaproteobacteria bacterium]MCB9698527.1 hypothetical protein [Alphaproteobacteria bacterium]
MTIASSVLVTAAGSVVFHGRIGLDFVVTGFVASALTYRSLKPEARSP